MNHQFKLGVKDYNLVLYLEFEQTLTTRPFQERIQQPWMLSVGRLGVPNTSERTLLPSAD